MHLHSAEIGRSRPVRGSTSRYGHSADGDSAACDEPGEEAVNPGGFSSDAGTAGVESDAVESEFMAIPSESAIGHFDRITNRDDPPFQPAHRAIRRGEGGAHAFAG